MKYFAYGSNLCPQRLKKRTPSARFVSEAKLNGHQLRFHKISRQDGSSKCDAFYTGNAGDVVWGAVYEIDDSDVPALDAAEDKGVSYEKVQLEAQLLNSDAVETVYVYVAREQMIKQGVQPYEWYKRYVLIGAKYYNFPEQYVQSIESIESETDPDESRRARHYAVQCEIESELQV